MDELFGYLGNGKTVGNYGFTNLRWQKWNFIEGTDGSYHFINQHTRKCLHEGLNGRIVQWDCYGGDESQKWKIIENPCGQPPRFPSGRFQIQNPFTGKCAVILNNSNADWAKVVSGTCTCNNNHHYWILRRKTLVNQGFSRQCMANWDLQGYGGITQCGCVDDPIHNWGFVIVEEEIFIVVTAIDGRCVQVNGDSENSLLRYVVCDLTDKTQWWRIYDACNSYN
ncbi:uncharacterized protein LOC119084160 [Bradysia coprophila]|uniref:uncharacterized protein LOC119084160 n=1 Tax=Bradysia coprophila TaxID=38358 RepID=UPI00187DD705|nr:uncharacterized protein LOC119084160 [Bradysia coprophila]